MPSSNRCGRRGARSEVQPEHQIVELWRAGIRLRTPVIHMPGSPLLYLVGVRRGGDEAWLLGPVRHPKGHVIVLEFGSLHIALATAARNGAAVPAC